MLKVKKSLWVLSSLNRFPKNATRKCKINIPSIKPRVVIVRRRDIGDKDDNRKRPSGLLFTYRYIN